MSLLGSLTARPVNKTPVPLGADRSIFSWSGATNRADRTKQLESVGGVGTLYAITTQLMSAVSQVEWGLFRTDDENPFTVEPWSQRDFLAPGLHPAARLWDHPNPFQTRQELMEALEQNFDLTGEAWIVIGRNARSRMPIELWCARPDRMEVVPSRTEYVAGYIYHADDGERIPLKRDSVLRVLRPHPLDPHRGMGAVQTIMAELDSSTYSAEWNRAFFRNSAQPGGVIEVPDAMSEDEFRRFEREWASQHKGVGNAGRVALLENGAKWNPTQMSMVDMQYVDMRRLTSDTIKQAFQFPKSMLGEADDVNRANAEAQMIQFARNLTRPRLQRFRAMLNKQLLPLFGDLGQGVEFEFVDPVTEDKESESRVVEAKSKAVASLVEVGFAPSAACAAVGLPEIEYNVRAAKVGGEAVLIDGDGNVDSLGPAVPADTP